MSKIYKLKKASRMLRPIRIINRFKKNEDGATAVEFAIVGGPFFLLIFAIIESAIYFLATQYIETVIDDMARLYRTGRVINTDAPGWDLRTRAGFDAELCRRIVALFNCKDIILQVDIDDNFTALPLPARPTDAINIDNQGNFVPTQRFEKNVCPNKVLQISASYLWPVYTNYALSLATEGLKNNKSLINVTAVAKTEGFSPAPGVTCS